MSHRILIVEDDADQQLLFAQLLTGSGYQVDTVGDAESALDRLSTEQIDLVLTDFYLPGMSGGELIMCLHDRAVVVRTILMSSCHDVGYEAARCHADGWFGKQEGIQAMRTAIAVVLASPAPA